MKILRKIIRQINQENSKTWKYETGAATEAGHQLILFADSDVETYQFALKTPDVKKVFDFALKQWNRIVKTPLVYDDEEMLFYDFAANFVMPKE